MRGGGEHSRERLGPHALSGVCEAGAFQALKMHPTWEARRKRWGRGVGGFPSSLSAGPSWPLSAGAAAEAAPAGLPGEGVRWTRAPPCWPFLTSHLKGAQWAQAAGLHLGGGRVQPTTLHAPGGWRSGDQARAVQGRPGLPVQHREHGLAAAFLGPGPRPNTPRPQLESPLGFAPADGYCPGGPQPP